VVNDSSNNALYGSTAYSIEFYGTPTSYGGGGYGRIVDKSNATTPTLGYELNIDTTNVWFDIVDTVGIKTVKTSSSVPLGSLVHVVMSWAGATTAPKIYINGVESTYSAQPTVGTPANDTSLGLYLGNYSAGTRTFDGTMQRVRIWRNYALSASDVTTLYNGGTVAGATADYEFTNGTGTTLTDSSGHGNDGTITAGTGSWKQNMVWNTNTAGTAATIKGAGVVSVDYVDMRDNTGDTSGGATYYAGTHSNNRSGNTNWTFTAPPAITNTGNFFLFF
jgi:hypothetical protein